MQEIKQILTITSTLRKKYKRGFTLDGKLVGDIGEVLAAEHYNLELFPENTRVHDAVKKRTRKYIQIKSSFLNASYFPTAHIPDYFLAIRINENGTLEELFNGPGQYIFDHYIKKRKLAKNGRYLYTLSGNILKELNQQVPKNKKI